MIKTIEKSLNNGDSDVRTVLKKIVNRGVIPFDCTMKDVSKDFMPALRNPVEGFSDGVYIFPDTPVCPFIAYMFKTANPDSLMRDLKEQVNPTWNIQSEPTDIICEAFGEYVFFAMIPKNNETSNN